MILGRNQHRLVSTWSFFALYSWKSVGPRGTTAQKGTSSSSYAECSGYVPFIGDSVCDELNNNAGCGYDGGDCCSCTCVDRPTKTCGYDADFNCTDPNVPDDCGETPSPSAAFGFPNCTGYIWDLGDEFCDDDLNNKECGYDGGDCCRCTCRSTGYTDSCGTYGYDCVDPDAPTDCDTASPTPSPAAAFGYPDCTGYLYNIQDGYCDSSLNNEECGYDGGDCCRCTCENDTYHTCGHYGYNCSDPNADTDCPTPSPTPSPAAGLGYPDCTGNMSNLQNGYCDWDLNNEDCGYDGGDCCRCTCEEGLEYDCGSFGFDCENPTAPTDCPTLSPTPTLAAGLGYPDCTGITYSLQDGRCDWDLNNEDCGYDGGDCCECSCTGNDGGYECGEGGYDCLDPDPCPSASAEISSKNTIVMVAIIFIACLCAVCAGCFVIGCMRVKQRAQTAGTGPTTHTTSASPPQQSAPNATMNNPVGQQPTVAHPVGSANPSRQVYVVNPQSAAAQSGQRSTAVMPRGRRAPPSTHGESCSRVASSRCAPIPEGSALERSASMAAVGHRPNVDTIEAKRIQLAVTESVRVQTISEAIFRQETCRPQSGAYPTITRARGGNPSDIVNRVNVEEKVPSEPEKKNNGKDEDSGSEWSSDGEDDMEEKTQQDNYDELGTEDDQQTDTGKADGDAYRHNETTRPVGTDKGSLSGITNDAYIEDNTSSNPDKRVSHQDAGSGSEWSSDGEGEMQDNDDELGTKVHQPTGTKVSDDADEQEGIVVPIGPACEEDIDNASHGGMRVEPSDNEGGEETESGKAHQASENLSVSLANPARGNGEIPDKFIEDDVNPDPSLSKEGNDPEDVEREKGDAVAIVNEGNASGKQ